MNHQGGLTTNPFDDDKLHEECGIFAVHGHKDAAALTALGLHALQHRGQESAGLVVCAPDKTLRRHTGMGLVADVFDVEALVRACLIK